MPAHEVALALPEIAVLATRSRILAVLDAILSPDWEFRYFSFDSRWAPGEEMASMRNGSGDLYSIVFSAAGAFIRGFAHESTMSPVRGGEWWPGLVDRVPEVFASCVAEAAFSRPGAGLEATVCIWRQAGDDRWHTGDIVLPDEDDPDGADWLFETLLDRTCASYLAFAEDYYETEIDKDAVAEIFDQSPLTDELVRRLNPDLRLADLASDLAEIGHA